MSTKKRFYIDREFFDEGSYVLYERIDPTFNQPICSFSQEYVQELCDLLNEAHEARHAACEITATPTVEVLGKPSATFNATGVR